jgi:hypothetical protein
LAPALDVLATSVPGLDAKLAQQLRDLATSLATSMPE